MVDFKKLSERPVKSKKLKVKIEFELTDSLMTEDEAAEAIDRELMGARHNNAISEAIVFLLWVTRSSLWDINQIEVTSEN